jgi:hypothetical protein
MIVTERNEEDGGNKFKKKEKIFMVTEKSA